jgi:hypothetical protein
LIIEINLLEGKAQITSTAIITTSAISTAPSSLEEETKQVGFTFESHQLV